MIHDSTPMDHAVTSAASMRIRWMAGAITGLLLLVGIALFPSIRRWSNADRAISATTVSFGTVTRGDLVREVSVQGRVVAAEHPTLVSPAQGTVSVRAKGGTVVRKGDLLAVVTSPELESTMQQARAQLLSLHSDWDRQRIANGQIEMRLTQLAELARTRLEASRRERDRAQRMFEEGLLNKLDYLKAQDDVHVNELETEQAKHEIDLSRQMGAFDVKSKELEYERQLSATTALEKKVDDLSIRAPFDGMVATVTSADGDAVAPNQGIVSIVNLSSLELELTIPEEYAGEVRIGTPITISYGAGEYPGRMTAVAPEVVGNQVIGRAVPDGGWPPGLKQNQAVTSRLVFESRHNVLKVPRGTFLESGGGRSAYVVDGKTATRRDITVGVASATEVEIASGLQEGERIILSDTSAMQGARSVILR